MSATAENSATVQKGKPRGRPFVKGQAANPGGRPKGWSDLRAAAREQAPRALDTLVSMLDAIDERVRVAAAVAILDRGFGRPDVHVSAAIAVAHVDLTGATDDELRLLREYHVARARRLASGEATGMVAATATNLSSAPLTETDE